MRQIGNLSHENHARRLSNYLSKQGIESRCEVLFEPQSGEMSYQIWIRDEDQISEAEAIFREFLKNPTGSLFDAPEPEPETAPPKPDEDEPLEEAPTHQFNTYLTYFFMALCALVFFFSTLQQMELKKEGATGENFLLTPIQADFMFDLPLVFEKLQEVIERYLNDPTEAIPPELIAEVQAADKTPYWKGFYSWVVAEVKGEDPASGLGPLFVKIREGEFWRLFTPCILHKDLLHILFNMLWLWYLGRPIEQRIGPFRTLLLTLLAGVGSNTVQYLMSGPFFIGYSGIVTALAGFIWMRERIAPWEGYPLNRGTILFLLVFILAILGLQIISFFLQVFTSYTFAPNIANTAHIAGMLIGASLARFSLFAQRVKT